MTEMKFKAQSKRLILLGSYSPVSGEQISIAFGSGRVSSLSLSSYN
jgi:hypothetical protein